VITPSIWATSSSVVLRSSLDGRGTSPKAPDCIEPFGPYDPFRMLPSIGGFFTVGVDVMKLLNL
jgi:hypothetical protein